MATLQGTQNALAFNDSFEATGDKGDGGKGHGNTRCIIDTFEIASGSAGSAAAADVIQMGTSKIPKGAVITDIIMLWAACGALVTIDIGDEDDDDRFAAAVDVELAVEGEGV